MERQAVELAALAGGTPMAELEPPLPASHRRARRLRRIVVFVTAIVIAPAGAADAKITIRPDSPNDNFFFHANYSTVPFDPATALGIQIWNCADGSKPI